MIGVIANPSEHAVVREFFELFKTPWEFYRSDGHYEVLLCDGEGYLPEDNAKLIIIYASQKVLFDAQESLRIDANGRNISLLSYKELRIPLYGQTLTFQEKGSS